MVIFRKILIFITIDYFFEYFNRLNHNRTSAETTTFHYSDLLKVQSEIEDYFQISSGISVSKLKLKAFEAPKVATINKSGKVRFNMNINRNVSFLLRVL